MADRSVRLVDENGQPFSVVYHDNGDGTYTPTSNVTVNVPAPVGGALEATQLLVKANTDNLDAPTSDVITSLASVAQESGGNLDDIKSNTDNLDILLSALRDAITGTGLAAKTLADVVTALGGTLAVSGPLTDAQLRAAGVPVLGPLTDVQLRASAFSVKPTAADGPSEFAFVPVGAHVSAPDISGAGGYTVTVPAGATAVLVQALTKNVRFTLDGTAPTANKGFLLTAGNDPILVPVPAGATLKVIQTEATADFECQPVK